MSAVDNGAGMIGLGGQVPGINPATTDLHTSAVPGYYDFFPGAQGNPGSYTHGDGHVDSLSDWRNATPAKTQSDNYGQATARLSLSLSKFTGADNDKFYSLNIGQILFMSTQRPPPSELEIRFGGYGQRHKAINLPTLNFLLKDMADHGYSVNPGNVFGSWTPAGIMQTDIKEQDGSAIGDDITVACDMYGGSRALDIWHPETTIDRSPVYLIAKQIDVPESELAMYNFSLAGIGSTRQPRFSAETRRDYDDLRGGDGRVAKTVAEIEEKRKSEARALDKMPSSMVTQVAPWASSKFDRPRPEDLRYVDSEGVTRYGTFVRIGFITRPGIQSNIRKVAWDNPNEPYVHRWRRDAAINIDNYVSAGCSDMLIDIKLDPSSI
jgi:hypothetical protein